MRLLGIVSTFGATENFIELQTRFDEFFEDCPNQIKISPEYASLLDFHNVEEYLLAANSLYRNSLNASNQNFVCLEDSLGTVRTFRELVKINNRQDLLSKIKCEGAYGLSEGDWVGHAYIIYKDSSNKNNLFECTINTPNILVNELSMFWQKNKQKYGITKFKPILKCFTENEENKYDNRIFSGGLGRTICSFSQVIS